MNQRSLRGRREARQADGEGRQTGSRHMGGVAGQGGEGKVIRDVGQVNGQRWKKRREKYGEERREKKGCMSSLRQRKA